MINQENAMSHLLVPLTNSHLMSPNARCGVTAEKGLRRAHQVSTMRHEAPTVLQRGACTQWGFYPTLLPHLSRRAFTPTFTHVTSVRAPSQAERQAWAPPFHGCGHPGRGEATPMAGEKEAGCDPWTVLF